MKLRLISFLLVFSILNGYSQINPKDYLPKNILKEFKKTVLNDWGVDSIYCYKYNESAGAIIENQRTYNLELTANGLVIKELTEIFENGIWVNNRLLENVYLPSEEIEMQLIKIWNTSTNDWQNAERSTYRYNANNYLTSLLFEKFNPQSGAWEFVNRNIYKYFNLSEPDEFLLQEWDGTNWVDKGQIFYSYNSNLQITSSIFRLWDTNQWVNANQTFETYNNDFKQTRTERETWNTAAQDWDNSTRATYSYNQENKLERVTNEIWVNQDSTWAFTDDNIHRYDFRKRNNELIIRNFDGTNFINYYRNKRTFDLNDNIKKVENQFFQGGFWVNDNYCDLFYSELQTSDTENITNNNLCNITQNNNSFSIDCPDLLKGNSPIIFEIHDLLGRLVFSKKINLIEKITPVVNDGLYVISFRKNGKNLASQKIYISN